MVDTAVWTAGIAGMSALGGVAASAFVNWRNERSRVRHDVAVRQAERLAAAADRRRTFEVENLLAAHDALGRLARQTTRIHLFDTKVARDTEHGYGGTLLPDDLDFDPEEKRLTGKTIGLILDDKIRNLAERANGALNDVGFLRTERFGIGRPVSEAEGEAAYRSAIAAVATALDAIAGRIRTLMSEVDLHPNADGRIPSL